MCGGVAAQHFKDSLFNSLVHHGVNVYGRYHIGFNKAPPPPRACLVWDGGCEELHN